MKNVINKKDLISPQFLEEMTDIIECAAVVLADALTAYWPSDKKEERNDFNEANLSFALSHVLSGKGYRCLAEVWYKNDDGSKRLDLLATGRDLGKPFDIAIEIKRLTTGSAEGDARKIKAFYSRQSDRPLFRVVVAYKYWVRKPAAQKIRNLQHGGDYLVPYKSNNQENKGKYWVRWWWDGPV